MNEYVNRALELAYRAHSGQVDKAGAPYMLHPLRIALAFSDPDCQIVALLHDVVEDTAITLSDIKNMGFNDDVISALNALTKRIDESYEDFISRASKNIIARQVKIKDLEDNMNLSRLNEITVIDVDRNIKYQKAYEFLFSSINN